MSKQLALSITLSLLAMTAFALLGDAAGAALDTRQDLRLPLSAKVPEMPSLSQFLPSLQ